jgi:hypothetical protein
MPRGRSGDRSDANSRRHFAGEPAQSLAGNRAAALGVREGADGHAVTLLFYYATIADMGARAAGACWRGPWAGLVAAATSSLSLHTLTSIVANNEQSERR